MTPTMRIPIVEPITAGRNIPDDAMDWQITGFRDVRMVEASQFERLIAVPVAGDSLKEEGILDGDYLITKITQYYEDGKLAVWQTPHGRTAKYAYFHVDDSIVLTNNKGWKQSWNPDEVKLIGIVVRVERDV